MDYFGRKRKVNSEKGKQEQRSAGRSFDPFRYCENEDCENSPLHSNPVAIRLKLRELEKKMKNANQEKLLLSSPSLDSSKAKAKKGKPNKPRKVVKQKVTLGIRRKSRSPVRKVVLKKPMSPEGTNSGLGKSAILSSAKLGLIQYSPCEWLDFEKGIAFTSTPLYSKIPDDTTTRVILHGNSKAKENCLWTRILSPNHIPKVKRRKLFDKYF